MSTFFLNFFHTGAKFCFCPVIFMSSTYTDKNILCFRWTNRQVPIRYFFPSKFQRNFLELSFPQQSCQLGVHINFVQEVPKDLQCLPKFSARKTYPCVWTFWFGNLKQSGSVFQFYLSAGRYCTSCLSVTIWKSCNNIHYVGGNHLGRRRALFSKKLRRLLNRLLQCDHGVQLCPAIFCNLGSHSVIFRWHMSITVA